jgi:hypothetical protein
MKMRKSLLETVTQPSLGKIENKKEYSTEAILWVGIVVFSAMALVLVG